MGKLEKAGMGGLGALVAAAGLRAPHVRLELVREVRTLEVAVVLRLALRVPKAIC